MRQAALDFLDCPGTLSHKLTQRLHVGPFQAARHRLNRLALSVEQQTLHAHARPVLPFPAPQGFQQVLEKMHQAGLEPFQGLRLRAAKGPKMVRKGKKNLT